MMEVCKDFYRVEKQKENLLKQKVKIKWLQERDRNSIFFNTVLKQRRKSNTFVNLLDNPRFGNSRDVFDKDNIFFKTLLSTENVLKILHSLI